LLQACAKRWKYISDASTYNKASNMDTSSDSASDEASMPAALSDTNGHLAVAVSRPDTGSVNLPQKDEDGTLSVNASANVHDDMAVATSAARSLKSMLNSLISQLKQQAGAAVTITGDFKLEIEGRQAFDVSLFQDDEADESPALEFKIEQQAKESILEQYETAVGARRSSGDTTNTGLKRRRDDFGDSGLINLTTPADSPKRKRLHTARNPSESLSLVDRAGLQNTATSPDAARSKPTAPPPTSSTSDSLAGAVKNISEQIRWAEQCRRIADEAHDKREEKWRVTSATFHDDNRRKLDAHNAKVDSHNVWLSQEMLRQSTLLNQLMGDVKGLYPLLHTVKWETPTNAFGATHASAPTPAPVAASPTTYMSPYVQHQPGNVGPGAKGARNGGHPLNSRSWKPG